MHPTSRILWRKAKLEHLWILSTKHDGSTTRMWPSASKAIPSRIPQAQRVNQGKPASQKSLWVLMQSNCLYLALCTNINSSSFFHLLVARTPWSHLQWASTFSLSWANAWLPANFRGNALVVFFSQACLSLLIMIFATFCRIQCLPLQLGQFLIMLQAQFLPWDLNPQLWLSWCPDMLHQTQLL
jgi:hypothetical protein